ncbi:hypothetical protein [Actinokineospora sp. UTMC 2448]|uniref:hypothetical protein n=1 Tax=Actinokineospora sp. UTMC 2448 TaxID=2268449 RepID=UPI002164C1F3|nr:hypothetical protein [Actinokineospora sp. UTMC 2448]UVS80659.1 hypothetical protein Actkin_04411 [Actinokineospora sp. UTMC 2448]
MGTRHLAWIPVVLLAVACGSTAGVGKPEDTRRAEPTSFGAVDTEEPTETGRGGGSGPDERTILVGGPRLDGRTDSADWPEFFTDLDGEFRPQCKVFRIGESPAEVPSVAVSVSVSLGGPFAFASDADSCAGEFEADCAGYTFPAQADWYLNTCAIQAVPTGAGTGALSVTFTASCPSARGIPCDDPDVAAAGPSAADPVPVSWGQTIELTAAPCPEDDYDSPSRTCREGPTTEPTTTGPDETTTTTEVTTAEPTATG